MRILLDTNVLARAAPRTAGLARELLLRCIDDPHVLLLSEFLVSELSRVLRYHRMRKAHGLSDLEIDEFIAWLESASAMVWLPDTGSPRVVGGDEEDDPIVAAAVAGRADVLCSRDGHLHQAEVVAFCRAHGIEVMDDVALMHRLREQDETNRG